LNISEIEVDLTEIIQDIEIKKTLVVGCSGIIIGTVAGFLDLDGRIKKRKTIFSENKKLDTEIIKSAVALTSGIGSVDYGGSVLSNLGECGVYTISSRVGFEIGHRVYKYLMGDISYYRE
tara:strand:- start:432 stop:791 length:360 start_codon:yes stop_codon:yes gene_type:complete